MLWLPHVALPSYSFEEKSIGLRKYKPECKRAQNLEFWQFAVDLDPRWNQGVDILVENEIFPPEFYVFGGQGMSGGPMNPSLSQKVKTL